MAELAGLRLIQINNDTVVITKKTQPISEAAKFYEREEEMAAEDIRVIGMFDKPDPRERETYADRLRKREITSLPEFL